MSRVLDYFLKCLAALVLTAVSVLGDTHPIQEKPLPIAKFRAELKSGRVLTGKYGILSSTELKARLHDGTDVACRRESIVSLTVKDGDFGQFGGLVGFGAAYGVTAVLKAKDEDLNGWHPELITRFSIYAAGLIAGYVIGALIPKWSNVPLSAAPPSESKPRPGGSEFGLRIRLLRF